MPTRIAGFVIDSSGNPVSGATVTPVASDGTTGTPANTDLNGFVAIAGLLDKTWTGKVATHGFQHAVETFLSDDLHNQSNTLSAHDFAQLRGKAVANQMNSGSAASGDLLTADGGGNAVFQVPAAKLKSQPGVLYIENPVAADEFVIAYCPNACTMKRVVLKTDAGTIDGNIFIRDETTPDSGTTKIWAADKQATSTGTAYTSFDTAAIGTGKVLVWKASAKGGSPTKLWVFHDKEVS